MCAARSSFRLLLTSLFLASALGSYAQVTISETDYQSLKTNLLEAKIQSVELETLRLEREKLLIERKNLLAEKELSLTEKQKLLDENQKLLEAKDKLIADLSISLTIACESLSEADQAAVKLEAENKLLKIGGVAGWVAALIAAGFIIFN